MIKDTCRYLVGDFETTVYEGQTETEVWASAIVELGGEDVKIFNSLPATYEYLLSLKCNVIVYYHNLKFDGSFWLSYLLSLPSLHQSLLHTDIVKFTDNYEMEDKSFKYNISARGQWYYIRIYVNGYYIELRDSLKLLPFSVARIGQSFGTKHK